MENTQMMVVDDDTGEPEKPQDNMKSKIDIIKGDITTQKVDAIVNGR